MQTTFVYKKIHNCEIKGDFYPVDEKHAPLIVYIHGGGLIWGTRTDIHNDQITRYSQAGFNVCSIAYRLAPETKLPEIKADIQDALVWLKETGKEQFHFDPEKIAVIGSSAGGYLALLSGTFSVKPKLIVSLYGYGNILGDWYLKPSTHFNKMTKVPEVLMRQLIQKKTIAEAPIEKRYAIYLYSRQQGKWLDFVTDWGLATHADKLREYCPIEYIDADYPATLLLHGDEDEDVPYTESVHMNKAINNAGGHSQLFIVPKGKHSFDQNMEDPVVIEAFDEIISFLKVHLSEENDS
ncbi:alpha/beta hydrolase [Virgibacillus sp. NKC19-3]|uniref:alpha/beta hydrolase n=1 Tax=Virgibacillus saliphilus TaxID=2831674 RepID=UPI001C9A6B6C|nr:alpha/beta hydrolase [Virgibacillus sp. NKC19-3]MBY7144221.1 alpha/beta hydrolase [Virgibacillus sp. NKC19-3]